jgi:site-specific DNA-methyltransferase (adenine-specific)
MHDRRGWEVLGFSSLEEWASRSFGQTPQHIGRLLTAAKIAGMIEGPNPLVWEADGPSIPEGTLRPLTALLREGRGEHSRERPDAREKINEAVSMAVARSNGKPTAKDVQAAVDEVLERRPADGGYSAPSGLVSDRQPVYTTGLGELFRGDCTELLPRFPDGCIDTIFCDPPFNLGKEYSDGVDDLRPHDEYLAWCFRWLAECIRVLKVGGSLFIYHLPSWNILLGAHLMTSGLKFRHAIAICHRCSLPIPGRLYPAHYSLLYVSKGEPNVFRRIYTPIETCRHCKKELRDYGGHRKKMNANGVNLMDVWTDITPVRHGKYKSPKRKANALSTKLIDRVVELTTREGDLVLDPFGGSGTTYAVCERKRRRWLGIDSEPEAIAAIVERLTGTDIHFHENNDFVEDTD